MSSSVLSSLKHEAQSSVFRVDKTREVQIDHIDQLILALMFRFEAILAQKIGRKV